MATVLRCYGWERVKLCAANTPRHSRILLWLLALYIGALEYAFLGELRLHPQGGNRRCNPHPILSSG